MPTTWDKFAAAGQEMRDSSKNVYTANDTGDAGSTLSTIWAGRQAGGEAPAENGGSSIAMMDATESQAYATNDSTTIDDGLSSWAEASKEYGEQQGFTIS